MKSIKTLVLTFLSLIIMVGVLVGCDSTANSNSNNTSDPTEATEYSEDLSNMLKIYEESMQNNIETYCEEYLTYVDTPENNLDAIKDIITADYLSRIETTLDYPNNNVQEDEKVEYEQATALSELFYSNYSTPSTRTKVLAQCYQTITVDGKVTTNKTFYIFNMKYEDNTGWLIDSVDIPSDAF